jgi:cytochrome o ubiquinol oxidase operon protein cyoD
VEPSLKEIKKEWHGSKRSYAIGMVSALLLTFASFGIVAAGFLPRYLIVSFLVALALIQAICQLRFFLHVGEEADPKWETVLFWFMLILLLAVVLGSFWIMFDLNFRVMGGM